MGSDSEQRRSGRAFGDRSGGRFGAVFSGDIDVAVSFRWLWQRVPGAARGPTRQRFAQRVLGENSDTLAPTIDDFDDNLTDTSLWSVVNSGSGVIVQEINQRLEVSIAADAAGAFGASRRSDSCKRACLNDRGPSGVIRCRSARIEP